MGGGEAGVKLAPTKAVAEREQAAAPVVAVVGRVVGVLAIALVTILVMGGGLYLLSAPFLSTPGQVAGQAQVEAVPVRPTLGGTEGRLIGMYLSYNRDVVEQPVSDDSTPVLFTIDAGESAVTIAAALQEAGLIADANMFRWLLRYRMADTSLGAGTFELNKAMTMDEIIEALQNSRLAEVVVTIPEGWRAEEVAALMAEQELFPATEYMALVLNSDKFRPDFDFLADLPPGSSLEGYLFPDTYNLFKEKATAEGFIRLQLETFGTRLTPALREQAQARNMTIFEAVTLASLVEREAVVAEERGLIAGVYINRWQDGTVLNADPTVQYALGLQSDGSWWKRPLTLDDLQVDSPYNSYTNRGLPPGPIASPGMASLEAAITAPDTTFYYFVARGDGSGTHVFAETLEEHNANVAREQGR